MFSVILKKDGTLLAFGDNTSGQCNVPSGTFKSIALGPNYGIGLRTDGTLVGWGDNTYGQTDVPSGIFTGITAGKDYAYAYTDTQIIGWGNPYNYTLPTELTQTPFELAALATSGQTTCLVYVSKFE